MQNTDNILNTSTFNAYIDPNNKWCLIFTDKDGKLINRCAIPPTEGDRTDLLCFNDLKSGYSFGIDAIIIRIEKGEITLIKA